VASDLRAGDGQLHGISAVELGDDHLEDLRREEVEAAEMMIESGGHGPVGEKFETEVTSLLVILVSMVSLLAVEQSLLAITTFFDFKRTVQLTANRKQVTTCSSIY